MLRRRMHGGDAGRIGRVPVLVIGALVPVLLLGGVAFAGYRYERAQALRILPGVRIAGVNVGDMTTEQARAALAGVESSILDRHVAVRVGKRSYDVTPREMGSSVDLDAAVQSAVGLSTGYSWPSRVFHRVANRPIGAEIALVTTHDRDAVARFVESIQDEVSVAARNASREFVDGRLVVEHAKVGRELRRKGATARVLAAIRDGWKLVTLKVERTEPEVTEDDFGKLIVVRVSENRLYLFDGFDLEKSYPVATGQLGKYDTPQGHWQIINKRINPTWVNPATDTWGKDEPDFIPPGPDNPLGTRALDLDAPGIRIHGTPAGYSIGSYASHGCIRMHIPQAEELFGLVGVGTPVIIAW